MVTRLFRFLAIGFSWLATWIFVPHYVCVKQDGVAWVKQACAVLLSGVLLWFCTRPESVASQEGEAPSGVAAFLKQHWLRCLLLLSLVGPGYFYARYEANWTHPTLIVAALLVFVMRARKPNLASKLAEFWISFLLIVMYLVWVPAKFDGAHFQHPISPDVRHFFGASDTFGKIAVRAQGDIFSNQTISVEIWAECVPTGYGSCHSATAAIETRFQVVRTNRDSWPDCVSPLTDPLDSPAMQARHVEWDGSLRRGGPLGTFNIYSSPLPIAPGQVISPNAEPADGTPRFAMSNPILIPRPSEYADVLIFLDVKSKGTPMNVPNGDSLNYGIVVFACAEPDAGGTSAVSDTGAGGSGGVIAEFRFDSRLHRHRLSDYPPPFRLSRSDLNR